MMSLRSDLSGPAQVVARSFRQAWSSFRAWLPVFGRRLRTLGDSAGADAAERSYQAALAARQRA